MYNQLKSYCSLSIPLSDRELEYIDKYFETKIVRKKDFLIQDSKICSLIGFIAKGSIRHFHIKDGIDRTCDISFDNSWVTDFESFTRETPARMNLQALEDTTIYYIQKNNLNELYKICPKYETFGRLMAEKVALRATDIAMSLSSEKPEERFNNLLKQQPDLFQRVPQKYIANFLGISPESLSRIQKRIHTRSKS